MKITAIPYYLRSISTLFNGFRTRGAAFKALTGSNPSQPFQVELKDGTQFLAATGMDLWILKETMLDRTYEKVGTPLQPNWTVVDVGAALGDYAVWAGRQLTRGRVIAVEPFPPSIELLKQNLRINLVNNCTVVEAAVAGQNGRTALHLVTGEAVQHSTAAGQMVSGDVDVTTLTLHDLFAQNRVIYCDLLKLDCEGAEYDILFNADPATLSRITRICMEIHDGMTAHNHGEMQQFLESHGYATRLTPNPVHSHLAYLYAERH